MKTIRKISEGVAGWLLYEFHCMNADMFDEKYLTKPIGNILKAKYGNRVEAEYNHPILNKYKTGKGRPPQIDLVIKNEKGELIAAVESKWYGNSPVKVKDIMWDLVRLEIIRNEYDIPCFFVLGGMKKRLNDLFKSQTFLEPNVYGKEKPLLTTSEHGRNFFYLTNPTSKRNRLIRNEFHQYSELTVPEKISVQNPSYYPKQGKNADHQIFAWEVLSNKTVNRFVPSKSKLYI
tara:strand:- start:801 stop:1499 length:699 start_codon:yes stop_codon:yes gene_type:complete